MELHPRQAPNYLWFLVYVIVRGIYLKRID
jgi:hypothetical protein